MQNRTRYNIFTISTLSSLTCLPLSLAVSEFVSEPELALAYTDDRANVSAKLIYDVE